jgi:hypothetical protein
MTKRLKLIGLLVIAMCALGAIASSAASAAAMALPEFTVATGGTSTSGKGELFGAATIKCNKDKDSQAAGSKDAGTFTVTFEECTVLVEECHSLGSAAKTIVTGGSYELVLMLLGATDSRLVLFKLRELHIECKSIIGPILVLIKGSVLGTIKAKNAGAQKEFEIKVNAKGKKEQEFKEYENNKGEVVKLSTAGEQLLSSTGGGAFEESGEEAGTDLLITTANTELIN